MLLAEGNLALHRALSPSQVFISCIKFYVHLDKDAAIRDDYLMPKAESGPELLCTNVRFSAYPGMLK